MGFRRTHPVVTALALRFTNAAANTEPAAHWKMPGQPPTHRKDGTTWEYIGDLRTLAVASPSKLAALLPGRIRPTLERHYLVVPDSYKSAQIVQDCVFTCAAEHTLSLTNMSSTYEEVARLTVSSCPITAFTMARIIWGATLSPNPKRVRQYLCPLIFTVWNGQMTCQRGSADMPGVGPLWRLLAPAVAIPAWFEHIRLHSPYTRSRAHSTRDSP